jgi:C-terminal processing protease CtpA/Prc
MRNPVSACYGGFAVMMLVLGLCPTVALGQGFSNFNPAAGRTVLKVLKGDIEKNYYDPEYRGIDLDALFNEAEAKISAAESTSQIFGIIAQTLLNFEDSHTFFLPPERASRIEYGWQMQMIGEECYVVAVKPGSDADQKGLRPGDRILAVDGYEPTRDILWMMHYDYYTVRPRPGMRVSVLSPDGAQREMDILAKVIPGKRSYDLNSNDIWDVIREGQSESRLHRHRFQEHGEDLFIWKMPQFDMTEREVDNRMNNIRKFRTLILDLRGNGGGSVRTLERLAGNFFDRDLVIAELKGRKEMDPQKAKSRGKDIFTGDLIVLVDSESGSAAEMFARIVQLEKRGTVLGDRTAGAVMQSRHYSHSLGAMTVFFYGVSITNADVIMSDGNSLERIGVTPDEAALPSADDLAAGRDPVLARAAELAGVELTAERAGSFFPIEWRN